MKIYVAGPMTGRKDLNYPEFFRVAKELRALGHEVINPAENNGATLEEALTNVVSYEEDWETYLRKDIKGLVDSDAICMLPDWQTSRGALLEHHIAYSLGIPVYIFREGKLQPRVQVIGISGYARSGKDTIADHLVTKGYVRASFADNIRSMLYRLDPQIYGKSLAKMVDAEGWESIKAIPQVRELLQRMGTEAGREVLGDYVWVNSLLAYLDDGAKVVIPDVRYYNEVISIEKLGGAIWRVIRPGVPAINSHISESALDGHPFMNTVYNDGTIEELHSWVDWELDDGE